jgi:hypothetical protein
MSKYLQTTKSGDLATNLRKYEAIKHQIRSRQGCITETMRGVKMKSTMAIVLAVFLLTVGSVFAVEESMPTIISGHVYEADGKTPVPSVEVKVTCNAVELTDMTNDKGYYVVEYFEGCPAGSEVSVKSGGTESSGTVGTSKTLRKNLLYLNFNVPEFGVLGASLALVGAVVAFGVFRKRK